MGASVHAPRSRVGAKSKRIESIEQDRTCRRGRLGASGSPVRPITSLNPPGSPPRFVGRLAGCFARAARVSPSLDNSRRRATQASTILIGKPSASKPLRFKNPKFASYDGFGSLPDPRGERPARPGGVHSLPIGVSGLAGPVESAGAVSRGSAPVVLTPAGGRRFRWGRRRRCPNPTSPGNSCGRGGPSAAGRRRRPRLGLLLGSG